MKLATISIFVGVASSFPEFKDRRYPTCTIVDFSQDEVTNRYIAQHKCKAKGDQYKCSQISLHDCVGVNFKNGNLVTLKDDDDTDGIKFLYTSCAECSYYGYSMSLWCLCGSGDDPNVYTPHTLELQNNVFVNRDGVLGRADGVSKTCVAKEIKCP